MAPKRNMFVSIFHGAQNTEFQVNREYMSEHWIWKTYSENNSDANILKSILLMSLVLATSPFA